MEALYVDLWAGVDTLQMVGAEHEDHWSVTSDTIAGDLRDATYLNIESLDDTITVASTSAVVLRLLGDAGDDELTGGPGDDLILGGPGNDILNGGGGNAADRATRFRCEP